MAKLKLVPNISLLDINKYLTETLDIKVTPYSMQYVLPVNFAQNVFLLEYEN